MRSLFRASIFIMLYSLLSACSGASQVTPATVTAVPSSTPLTVTPLPSQTATATVIPTTTQAYTPPTLIPTIDPMLLPDLLRNALSIQAPEGINGHALRRITGWEHGFGAGIWQYSCPGFAWLDTDHLLLYPTTGQENGGPEGIWTVNVAPQPVVINLKTGHMWLPVEETSAAPWSCYPVFWSKKPGILIVSGTYNGEPAIFTYTLDGERLAYYPGDLSSISPSRTKILMGENTLIDLRTNQRIALAWSLENYSEEDVLSGLFWTSDETRIYRCCYFYADLTTGASSRFKRSDFQDTHGNHLDPDGLWFYRGQWVRNDKYFLVTWSWIDDGDIRYLPMLDPAKKIFIDVREMAGISEDWSCEEVLVSPDGRYIWMAGWGEKEEGNYLVDLSTFKAQYYPGKMYLHIDWSPNSKFAWLYSSGRNNEKDQYFILSIADKKISPLPVNPLYDGSYRWHETRDILVYPSEDKNHLIFLNTSTMSFRQLSFTIPGPEYSASKLTWSPDGEKIGFVAGDGSLWQVEYPKLENVEQLTPPLPDVHNLNWSPDGNSIAFTSGSDIYIVDTVK